MLLKIRLLVKAFFLEYIKGAQLEAVLHRWYADEGDRKLRYVYPLNGESVVFDIGGYHGDFAAEISRRYDSRVYVFEPMPIFHEYCECRLRDRPKLICLPYGLSNKNERIPMALADDASGLYNPKNAKAPEELILLRAFNEVMSELNLTHIDLIKVNIEGGEYPLLECLLDTGLIEKVNHIQVQFHDFAERAVERRSSIRARLAVTHSQDWCYPFIWESWTRR